MTSVNSEIGGHLSVACLKICERFGQVEANARRALPDYLELWPAGHFEVKRVPDGLGVEFAIVQHIGTTDSVTTPTKH